MTGGKQITGASPTRSRAKIWPDMHVLDRLTREQGLGETDSERAESLGIDPSVLSRLRNRQCSAGADLVYRLPILLGVDPQILFIREEQ